MKKFAIIFLLLLGLLFPGSAWAAGLDVRPLTWDVIGLDSSEPKIPTGPNLFPVGAEICNDSGADITDLESEIVWDTANPYIEVDGPSTDDIGSLAAGDCIDTFFVASVQKTSDAWNTARGYRILASASGGWSGETPSGRQLYVERIISQNRNATKAISGAGGCNADYSVCDPAPTDLEVGREYTYKLYAETSSPHDQLTSFITFPGNIFQIEHVRTSYELPPGAEIEGPYADACGWQPDPSLPDYLSCVGPPPSPFAPGGKAGGRVVSTYTVKVIGHGQGTLTSLINDHSGSSYHYNNDYGSIAIDFQSRFPLSVEVRGQGSVLSDPAGIDCGSECLASYPEGTLVTLQATPEPGHTFLGWEGACASFGTDPTCQVEMNQAQNAIANFSGDVFYPLRVETTTGGKATSDVGGIDCPDTLCTQTYEAGTIVSLQAEALPGYQFVRWEEDCTSSPCSVTMDGPRLVRAVFEPIQPEFHTLLFRYDSRGRGTSSSVPSQSGQIDCGISCLATYPDGALVTVRAEALPGYQFVSWEDDCAGTPAGEDCVLLMTEDHIASATYERIAVSWPLDVEIVGQGKVLGSGIDCPGKCEETYPDGTEITLEATPASGWKFVGWEGDCQPSGTTCSAQMNQARSVRARFATGQREDPRLRIRIDVFRKQVLRGNFFRARLAFSNINKVAALDARPCLRLPRGVKIIKGGVAKGSRVCWKRGDLLPGKPRKFNLLLRARSLGKKKFLARGTAINAPSVEDRDRIRVFPRPAPHPPTG